MSEYIITEFVSVAPGEPFRLLPFGRIVKNGKSRVVTKELAQRMILPHFRPPIKLGSHKEETPAGGHLIGLEVRDDGLWGIPEYNEEGAQAVKRGAYRYHSPEIIWEGGLENPETGEITNSPMIIGDALLHTPHLGEAAAMYSIETLEGENTMSESVTVPVTWLDRLLGRVAEYDAQPPQPQEPPQTLVATTDIADEYAAVVEERNLLQQRVDEMAAQAASAAAIDRYTTELGETAFAGDVPLAELLSGLPEETAEEILRRFKSAAAQVQTAALTADVGHEGLPATGDQKMILDAAIKTRMADGNISYATALSALRTEQPQLFEEV